MLDFQPVCKAPLLLSIIVPSCGLLMSNKVARLSLVYIPSHTLNHRWFTPALVHFNECNSAGGCGPLLCEMHFKRILYPLATFTAFRLAVCVPIWRFARVKCCAGHHSTQPTAWWKPLHCLFQCCPATFLQSLLAPYKRVSRLLNVLANNWMDVLFFCRDFNFIRRYFKYGYFSVR